MSQPDMMPNELSFGKAYQFELLVACYQNREALKIAASLAKLEDFSMPICQVVWEGMLSYFRTYDKSPGPSELQLLVAEVVHNAGGRYKSSISPVEYEGLVYLMQTIISSKPVNWEFITSKLSMVLHNGRAQKIVEGFDPLNPTETINRLISEQNALASAQAHDVMSSLCSNHGMMLTDEDHIRVSTGCSRLDRMMDGGPMPGELAMITGVPGTGKTNVLTHLGVSAAINFQRALVLSLELAGDLVRRRAMAMMAGIEGEWIKRPVSRWSDRELKRLQMVLTPDFMIGDFLHVEGMNTMKHHPRILEQKIVEWKRRVKNTVGTDEDCLLVCVDWLDCLALMSDNRNTNEYLEIAKTVMFLKQLAEKHNVVIWTATQGNKEADGKSIVRMGNTAGGFHKNDGLDYGVGIGNAEESQFNMGTLDDADQSGGVVLRTDKHMIFTVNKNRHGSVGPVKLYQAPTLRFYDTQEAYTRHIHDLDKPNLNPELLRMIAKNSVPVTVAHPNR